jgi:hypothetical protein
MNNIRKEIRDLITINEKIQSAVLNGDHITDDELTLIRQCASELLEKIPAATGRREAAAPHPGGGHGISERSVDASRAP